LAFTLFVDQLCQTPEDFNMKAVRDFCGPLLLIVVGCALLRLWGIDFAPASPHARPDEETFITRAFEMMAGPQGEAILASGWPEGFFRIQYALLRLEGLALRVVWGHPVNLGCLYALNPGAVELPARLFSALCDLLAAVVVGLTVARLVPEPERRCALLLGVLVYGCNYLAVRNAHFGVSDSTLVLCFTLCLYFALRAAVDHPRYLVPTAASAGVAFSIKYSAVSLVVPCIAAADAAFHLFRPRKRTLRFMLLALLALALVIALVSPAIILHPNTTLEGFLDHAMRYSQGNADKGMDPDWKPVNALPFYLFDVLPASFGAPGFILAVVGLLLLLVVRPVPGAILLASAATALAVLHGLQMVFVRYAAPVIPSLAAGLGYLLVRSVFWLRGRLSRPVAWAGSATLVVAALLPPLWTSLQFDHLIAQLDTRDLASRWLMQRGAQVSAMTQGWYSQVHLLDLDSELACVDVVPSWLNPGVPIMPVDDASLWPSAVAMGEIGWAFIANDSNNRCIFRSDGMALADYMVVGRIVLPCGRLGGSLENRMTPEEATCFQQAELISPGAPSCQSSMDLFDYFALPFTGFDGWERPGPRIEILRNICKR
jgi:hypothetical protein